eukprot:4828839-Amphidinium_carterae.1
MRENQHRNKTETKHPPQQVPRLKGDQHAKRRPKDGKQAAVTVKPTTRATSSASSKRQRSNTSNKPLHKRQYKRGRIKPPKEDQSSTTASAASQGTTKVQAEIIPECRRSGSHSQLSNTRRQEPPN